MSLLSRLAEKSWEPTSIVPRDPIDYRPRAAAVGLWVYFGVASVLFGLVFMAYLMRMDEFGMAHGAMSDWRSMPEPPLIWVNSIVLALSSVSWEAARSAARRDRSAMLLPTLLFAGLLALLFLAGQLVLWSEFAAAGYFAAANPANAFFYLLTALHGLHIAGGLGFWGRTTARVLGGAEPAAVAFPVELCAAYWHFLLLVWLVMLGLLIST